MNKRVYITVLMLLYALLLGAQQALGFKVTDINGASHDLYQDYLSKGKYVVLEIFFSNNPPSNNIAHDLFKLYESWGQGQFDVQFIALTNKDFDNKASLQRFTQRYRSTLPHVSAEGGSLEAVAPYLDGPFGQILILPAFIIIKPDGSVLYNLKGDNEGATLKLIDSVLLSYGLEKPYVVSGKVVAYENPLQAVDITAQDSAKKTSIRSITDQLGEYKCIFRSKPNEDSLYIQPFKNSRPDSGVSSLDLVYIAQHIINFRPFTEGWQYIAADIDRNKVINAIDLVLLRKLLLGIDTVFHHNTSWRFYPQNYVFEKPEDALRSEFPETIRYLDMLKTEKNSPDFNGVKVGDINGTSNKAVDPTIRNKTTFNAWIVQSFNGQGQTIQIKSDVHGAVSGFQFALDLPAFSSLEVSSDLPEFGSEHYFIQDQRLYITFFAGHHVLIGHDQELLRIKLQGVTNQEELKVVNSFNAEWYDQDLRTYGLQFEFQREWGLVYPNPCMSEIFLPKNIDYQRLNIYDIHGGIVKTGLGTGYPQAVDVSYLAKGTYVIRLFNGQTEVIRQKFVKL